MSGHCRNCGYDGCVCDDEERTNRNVSKLLPHEKKHVKKLVMTDRSHQTKQSQLKYNTLTKRNNEQTN
jgi:hypothetical protein